MSEPITPYGTEPDETDADLNGMAALLQGVIDGHHEGCEIDHTKDLQMLRVILALQDSRRKLTLAVETLDEIVKTPYCYYESPSSPYGTGVADGHRCAANVAKVALAALTTTNPPSDAQTAS